MKTKLLFIVVFISNFCLAQFPTNGLVAQYGFDSGSLLVDGANGINLTQTGSALTQINNRFENAPTSAVSLNGDYLTRPNVTSGTVFSISFWIKTVTNDNNSRTIIDDSDATGHGYSVSLQNGKIRLTGGYVFTCNAGTYTISKLSNNVVSDGNWHHIVVSLEKVIDASFNTTNHIIRINVDDLAQETYTNSFSNASCTLTSNFDTNGNLVIGNNRMNNLAASNKYSDIIDDILIYNRLLTPTEINSIGDYNSYCYTPQPTILSTTAITQTTATINITGTGTYDIAYHKTSDTFSNALIINGITSGSTNLTGLDIFTNYKVYVKKHCANNTTGWSLPINFSTTRTIGRIYVNGNASGNNNGISWLNAYTKLENALAIAQNNEEIWITEGTYKPHATSRTTPFTINALNLKLYGGFVGNETQISERIFGIHETILSGDLSGNDDTVLSLVNSTRNDNSYNVLYLQGQNCLLDRLTITGGHANGTTTQLKSGAGIYKVNAVTKMTINNCKIMKNVANDTGGALNAIFDVTSSELIVSNCEFTENLAAGGGAIYSYPNNNVSVTYTVSNSLFKKNQAVDTAILGYSGSSLWLRAYGTSSTAATNIANCTFVDNIDTGTFAGINNFNRATLVLSKRTSVSSNHNATISNCILWNNKAAGGITSRPISGLLEDVINPITIKNSIDETNFTGVTLSGTSANTSNSNPLFTNAVGEDYTLSSTSPAINTGDNTNVIGSTDLLGNQRIYNTTVDMGAYEFGSLLNSQTFNSFKNFIIYPNPTSSILNISSNEEIKLIEIYSLEGKLIFSTIENKIDISNLKSGLYVIKVTNNKNEIGVKKLIKE